MSDKKFQAFGPSGSEEVVFVYFLCTPMVQTQDPLGRAVLDPGPLFEQTW